MRRRQLPGSRFKSREFVARCVGLAPKTLAKAEAVVEAADRDPRFRLHVMSMDETGKVGQAFHAYTLRITPPLSKTYNRAPADREFGERLIASLVETALGVKP